MEQKERNIVIFRLNLTAVMISKMIIVKTIRKLNNVFQSGLHALLPQK